MPRPKRPVKRPSRLQDADPAPPKRGRTTKKKGQHKMQLGQHKMQPSQQATTPLQDATSSAEGRHEAGGSGQLSSGAGAFGAISGPDDHLVPPTPPSFVHDMQPQNPSTVATPMPVVSSAAALGSEYRSNNSNSIVNHWGLGLNMRPEPVPQMGMNTPLGFHVPQASKEKIWEGSYVDLSLLYKDTANAVCSRAPDQSLQFVVDDGQLVIRKPGPLRKRLDMLDMWQSAFHTYMAIHGHLQGAKQMLRTPINAGQGFAPKLNSPAPNSPQGGNAAKDKSYSFRDAVLLQTGFLYVMMGHVYLGIRVVWRPQLSTHLLYGTR